MREAEAGAQPQSGRETVRFPFHLVATDLDGTLLREDLTVSRRTRHALSLIRKEGAHHLVVTGRSLSELRPILEDMDYRGIAVCSQGTQIYDAATDQLLGSATPLDDGIAREAVGRIAVVAGPMSLAVMTSGLENRFIFGPGYAQPGEFPHSVPVPEERLWDQPIEKVLLRHPVLDDDSLTSLAAASCGSEVTVIHSGDHEIELRPVGVDKVVGLAKAAELLSVSRAQVLAFGDMPNDIAMLRWAQHGVAMGNAHRSVISVADEVAPTNLEDGVAAVLERLLY